MVSSSTDICVISVLGYEEGVEQLGEKEEQQEGE
jgi:hypothetical protein